MIRDGYNAGIQNHKYSRDGHLFKERFKSEPVNDMAYFTVLLRYIHQNPVKAGIVENVKDYEYSSWGEYDGTVEPIYTDGTQPNTIYRPRSMGQRPFGR